MRHLLRHAEALIRGYDGGLPLHHFLKGYSAKHRALGSRDRKALAAIVYAYYRASRAIASDDLQTQIGGSLLLCSAVTPVLRGLLPPEWMTQYESATAPADILMQAGIAVDTDKLLAPHILFSEGITREEYLQSLLRQPRLFLRIRNNRPAVQSALQDAVIVHEWMGESCLALPNGTKVEGLLPEESYVVQDASSQATADFMNPGTGQHWWDVCCGAGGKSLLLLDKEPGAKLLATDIRAAIIRNLLDRFGRYRLRPPQTSVLDAAEEDLMSKALRSRRFDGIVCDVPCTGAGTWARTPEGAYFFDPAAIQEYAKRQEKILLNALQYLKPGGTAIYLTCSVFQEENEEVVHGVLAKAKGIILERMRLINGIPVLADSLFGAVLRKEAG